MQTTWLERGTVSGRVALLLRSAEIQPLFERFVRLQSITLSITHLKTITQNQTGANMLQGGFCEGDFGGSRFAKGNSFAKGLAARVVDQQTPSHTPPTPPSAEGGLLKRPLSVRPGPGRSLESRAAGGRSAAPPFCKRGAATRVWRPTPGAEVPWARARRRPDDARGHHAPFARRYSPASRALALPAGRAAKTPRRAPPGVAGRPG